MSKISRRIFLGAGAAFSAVGLSQLMQSCSRSPSNSISPAPSASAPATDKAVNLYSSRHYNTDNELYALFTQETGIKINLVEGSADELIERIKSEGNNSPADILMTVDIARLWRAQQAGVFTPVTSSLLTERIPANLRQPQGYWFGFTKRARVIMYNKDKVKPSQLSTYEDLADPKWKGKIVMRSASNTYNQSLVASLVAADGAAKAEAWCRGLVANFARPPQGNDVAQIEAVASGLAELTLANTYYLARYGKSSDPTKKAIFSKIGVFFPNQTGRGAHVNISGAGLVKTAPHREEGLRFLEFLVSDRAQEFFAQTNEEYPVVSSIAVDPVLGGFGPFKADETNLEALGTELATAAAIMDKAGWK